LEDIFEGKKISVDPQYFPGELGEPVPKELPQEYDDDEEIDYGLDDEDQSNLILNEIGLPNYENVKLYLEQQEITPKKTEAYINYIIKNAEFKTKQLNGYKANITKKFKSGKITEADRQFENKRI